MSPWRQIIESACGVERRPLFRSGLPFEATEQLERALQKCLPPDLGALLQETDGVLTELRIGECWVPDMWLVLRSEEIASRHLSRHRTPPDRPPEMLVIADAGVDGICFGYLGGTVSAWNPLGREHTPVANGLREFLEGWLGGSIHV